MKIAQIAPVWTAIPPVGYGGAEKIISLLTDELVRKGHDVTLFASGDSKTKAKLVSVCDKSPGLSKEAQTSIVNNMNHIFNIFLSLEQEKDFDVMHWHVSKDLIPIMAANLSNKSSIITIHNHFYDEEMELMKHILDYYRKFPNFISVSNFHRRYFPYEFISTVYNGINLDEFDYNENPENYLVWIGRFESTKGVHLAIEAAIKLKIKLKLAGPKDENDYYEAKVKPYLNNEYIEYVGEVNVQERNALLRNAKLFLNPIFWDEPFGLVVPEANACGTPVVAARRGAMPELIEEGYNGFIVEPNNLEAIVEGIKKVYSLPPAEYLKLRYQSRKRVEEHFTYQKMTENYEKIYQKISKRHFLW